MSRAWVNTLLGVSVCALLAGLAFTSEEEDWRPVAGRFLTHAWPALLAVVIAIAVLVARWVVLQRRSRQTAAAALVKDQLAGNRQPAAPPDTRLDPSLRRFVTRAGRRWLASRIYLAVLAVVIPAVTATSLLFGSVFAWMSHKGGFWVYPIAGYFASFVLPVLLSLPVLLPWAVYWRNPRRIVVFRRFHIADNVALGRVLTRYIARYGHVFTLSDRRLRLHWSVRIPVFLGQLSLIHFRPRRIDGDGRLFALSRLLAQRIRLNVNWLVSYRKLFTFRTSDGYWRKSVRALLDHADLALIDLSEPSESLLWEIGECMESLSGRTIFIVPHDKYATAVGWIDSMAAIRPGIASIPLFAHWKGRILEEEAFRQSIAELLSQVEDLPAPVSLWRTCALFAGTVATGLGVAVLTLGIMAPFFFPALTAKHSPFGWQLEEVYFGSDSSAQTALLRLDRIHHDAAIADMIDYARHGLAPEALRALGQIGDRRTIGPVMEFGGSPDESVRKDAAAALKQLSIRLHGEFERESLSVLRSYPSELDARVAEPLDGLLREAPSPIFADLLGAPARAARFTAALRLGAEADSRTIPVLLEMMRWSATNRSHHWFGLQTQENTTRPFDVQAHALFDAIGRRDDARVEIAWLAPYFAGSDQAAFDAVWLAFWRHGDQELKAALSASKGDDGIALVSQLAEVAKSRGKPDARRAAALIRAAPAPLLYGMVRGDDKLSRARASIALGARGDAAVIRPALELACITESQWFSVVHPYEPFATTSLDYLAEHSVLAAAIPTPLTGFDYAPMPTVGALVRVLAKAGRDETIRSVVNAFTLRSDATTFFDLVASGDNRLVGAAIPARMNAWMKERAQGETDPRKRKILDSLFEGMNRPQ